MLCRCWQLLLLLSYSLYKVFPKYSLLRSRELVDSTIVAKRISRGFYHIHAPLYIWLQEKSVLRHHLKSDIIITCAFPTAWTSRLPDLNPCHFCVRRYFKSIVHHVYVPISWTLKHQIICRTTFFIYKLMNLMENIYNLQSGEEYFDAWLINSI